MKLRQNDLEIVKEKIRKGELTATEANVELVRISRVLLVTSRIPAEVRKALNAAVKRGYLAHIKKDGRKPEAYYHPAFDYLAKGERRKHENSIVRALAGVCG